MVDFANPIHQPLEEIFKKLNSINGLLHHLENQLGNFRKMFTEGIKKSKFDLSNVFVGSALVISDITEWPEDGWRIHYSTGSFHTRGEEYLALVDVLVQREASWAVSQGYESFETFLYDIVATFLANNVDKADSKKLGKARTPIDTLEDWKQFVRKSYRGKQNKEIFKYFRDLAPDLTKAEKHNNRQVDLSEWYSVVTEVRHAATHSNLVIKSVRITGWPKKRIAILNKFFPGELEGTGYILHLNRKNAEETLRGFAEYAFIIFKCLSNSVGYDWQIFKDTQRDKKNLNRK
ncbi:MAG: hypothetical protein Q8M92_07650 [Candidatus Subteraquimicrobiales bacterium]|nr:hypothetical protein [Candidatus Subteraquimicrobiales bacterium]